MSSETAIILPSGRCLGSRKTFSEYSKDEMIEIIKECNNMNHIINILQLHRSYYRYIKKFINDNNINTDHFKNEAKSSPIETNLVIGTKHISSKIIKQYLIRNNIVKEQCSVCNILSFWNNKPLTLQLDHINGNHYDNRVENLRLICPNCHSQTETFT